MVCDSNALWSVSSSSTTRLHTGHSISFSTEFLLENYPVPHSSLNWSVLKTPSRWLCWVEYCDSEWQSWDRYYVWIKSFLWSGPESRSRGYHWSLSRWHQRWWSRIKWRLQWTTRPPRTNWSSPCSGSPRRLFTTSGCTDRSKLVGDLVKIDLQTVAY